MQNGKQRVGVACVQPLRELCRSGTACTACTANADAGSGFPPCRSFQRSRGAGRRICPNPVERRRRANKGRPGPSRHAPRRRQPPASPGRRPSAAMQARALLLRHVLIEHHLHTVAQRRDVRFRRHQKRDRTLKLLRVGFALAGFDRREERRPDRAEFKVAKRAARQARSREICARLEEQRRQLAPHNSEQLRFTAAPGGELAGLRQKCHATFDPLWKSGRVTRQQMYRHRRAGWACGRGMSLRHVRLRDLPPRTGGIRAPQVPVRAAAEARHRPYGRARMKAQIPRPRWRANWLAKNVENRRFVSINSPNYVRSQVVRPRGGRKSSKNNAIQGSLGETTSIESHDEFSTGPKLQPLGVQFELDLDMVGRKLALVAEAKSLFGTRAARKLWRDLGLPDVQHDQRRTGSSVMLGHFQRFLSACTIADTSAEITARDLRSRYDRWRVSAGAPELSSVWFGRLARDCGLDRRKSGSIIYIGVGLRAA
ncbi:hypothetical protein ATER59S_04280 [Aquamicrobium terrae]